MKTDYFKSVITKSMYMLFALLIFSHCTTKVQIVPKTNDELVMTEYIASNSDFSEFNKLLISAKLGDILSIRGPYTLFLPTNDAMFAYYIEKNIKSYADLDSTSQKNLVYNHIVPQEYSTAVFQWGTLKTKNALGDNIVTEFEGPNIIINKYAKIFYKPGINARDIQVSNGTIQIIDKVLDPVTLNVYDLLAAPNS